MIRWAVVTVVVVAAAGALVGTYRYDPKGSGAIMDELLVYEITPSDAVQVKVPAGVDTVLVTLWAVLPRETSPTREALYDYGVKVELSTSQGVIQHARHYGTVSRLSADPDRGSAFSAKLVDSDQPVTDPRTIEVDTSAIAQDGGQLRVRAQEGAYPTLLTRLSYRFARGPLEQRLVERSLGPDDYKNLLARTTALGFVDLAPHARAAVLSTWSRRLTADGKKGTDYRVRRLLVGDQAALAGRVEPRVIDSLLLPHRMAALNLRGPADVRIAAPSGVELRMREGSQVESALRIPENGYRDIPVTGRSVRTLFVASTEPVRVRFALPRDQLDAQLGGDERVIYPDGLVQIAPDIRTHTYYRLDPQRALLYRIAPGQGPLRVRVRAVLDPVVPALGTTGKLTAQWQDADGQTHASDLEVELTRSVFESFGDFGHASEGEVVYITPPAGAPQMGLRGDRKLAISASVREPGVEESLIEAPYDTAAVPLDQEWRFAPFASSRWASVRPVADEPLELEQRTLKLQAQVRLEPRHTPLPGVLPQRALSPLGAPVRRQLLAQRPVSELQPDDSALFELSGAKVRLRVQGSGPRARRIGLRYYADAAQVGQWLRVQVDGELAHEQRLMVSSGKLELPLSAGVRELSIEGLGEHGVAYVDARPLSASHFVRSAYMAELSLRRPLVFQTSSSGNELYSLVLFAATEGSTVPMRIEFKVDGGEIAREPGVFFERRTEAEGVLEAVSGDFEQALLLQASRGTPPRASEALDGVSRLRIRLGDDLGAGRHRIKLRLLRTADGPERVWLRAVLVGENAPATSDDHRAWIREVD